MRTIIFYYALIISLCIGLIGINTLKGFGKSFDNGFDNAPEIITLNIDGKKPAIFNHKFHQDNVDTCMICHDPELMDLNLLVSDKNYAHKEGCGSCHSKIENMKKFKCKDCHPRKKRMIEGC